MIWSFWTDEEETQWSEDRISLYNVGVTRNSILRGKIADWRTLAIF